MGDGSGILSFAKRITPTKKVCERKKREKEERERIKKKEKRKNILSSIVVLTLGAREALIPFKFRTSVKN